MNNWTKLVMGFLVLLSFGLSVHAFPFTAFLHGPSNLGLQEDTSATVLVDINNVDFHGHHVRIFTFTENGFIEAKPALKSFDLAPYERTQIGVTITASDDAEHTVYGVTIRVEMDGQTQDVPLKVYVGANPFLSVNTFQKNVCANEYVESITASVKNNTSSTKAVKLKAEQPILFPSIEDDELFLNAGETELVEIKLNVSPPNIGEYTGTFEADTNEIMLVHPFTVKVNDCPNPIAKTISLILPNKPKDLVKNQTTLIPITVKNLTNEPQLVDLYVVSLIPSKNQSVTIGPKENAIVNLQFSPTFNTPAGTHSVEVTAVASGYSIAQTMNVKVLPLNLLELEQVNNVFEIAKGETKTISYVLYNHGDNAQSITFGIETNIPDTSFTFEPASLFLDKGKSAIVKLGISVDDQTSVTTVNTHVLALGNRSMGRIPLAFSVVEKWDLVETILEFVSFPQHVKMGLDEQKEVTFSIRNPTERVLSHLRFKLVGVKGSGISVVGPQDFALMPLETKAITLTLVTQNDALSGLYSPVLVVQGKNALGSVPFSLEVEDNSALGLLTGLVTFAGGRAIWIGLFVLAILFVYWFGSHIRKVKQVWERKPNKI